MLLPMKNLLLSSVLLLFVCACKLGHYNKLIPIKEADANDFTSVLRDHSEAFLFKTDMTVYGRSFGGLLVAKQMQPHDYRVIFTTELGMKLFDFEFTDTAFTLHYCVPQFNRPALLKIIQRDIQILLMSYPSSTPLEYYTDAGHSYQVMKVPGTDHFSSYYFLENSSKHLAKIEYARKNIKKTTFVLGSYSDEGIPEHIAIQHHDLKLKIVLRHLKK